MDMQLLAQRRRLAERMSAYVARQPGRTLLVRQDQARRAIGWSVRNVQKAMAAPKAKRLDKWMVGADSLATFCRESGTSADYILLGTSHSDSPRREGAPLPNPAAAEWGRAVAAVWRAAIGGIPSGDSPPFWVTPLYSLIVSRDLVPYKGSDRAQLNALGAMLRGPLKAAELDPATMGERAFADYVMTMIPVLSALASYREREAELVANRRIADEQHRRAMRANTRTHHT